MPSGARWVLGSLCAILCAGFGAASAHASRVHALASTDPATSVTSNWAGYVVGGAETTAPTTTSFTSVSAKWVQPAVSCATRRSGYSAFWLGLGGAADTSRALEQIGTEADCRAGKPAYSMWYELVPAPSVRVKYKILPGNVVTASVRVNGPQVSLQIRNLTRRTNFIKKLRVTTPDLSSAEWIAEAPSSCDSRGDCTPLPLANFGTVSFTHALATVAGHAGTILDPGWSPTALELIEESGRFAMRALPTGAAPSPLASDGASFAVAWQDAITPPDQGGSTG
jgi:hypothetical protein